MDIDTGHGHAEKDLEVELQLPELYQLLTTVGKTPD
jgi:hypothetical protein